MPVTILGAWILLAYWILILFLFVGGDYYYPCFTGILGLGKLTYQGHKTSEWQRWEVKLILSDDKAYGLSTNHKAVVPNLSNAATL